MSNETQETFEYKDTAIEKAKPTLPIFDNPTPGQLLQLALAKDSGIDVIERITALMEKERDYQARVAFDDALTNCQKYIGRIAPNAKRENGIMWADYAHLDRAIRPIYTAAGFAIGFSEDSTEDGRLNMKAIVSRGGITREYKASITRVAGNSKMNQADAEASAASRVKRYLLLDIFNIAVGIDADEKQPYEQEGFLEEGAAADFLSNIEAASNFDELQTAYFAARDAATDAKDVRAGKTFAEAKNKRYKELARKK